MGIYKSYFNYELKEPLCYLSLVYKVYKGGGDCDRKKQHFEFTNCGIHTATDKDYHDSLYDKGHLANAEDFTGDCGNDEKTFCYFNCVPQTIKLNRGIRKTWETKIRTISQNQPLYIVAGNIYGQKTIGNRVAIPDYCYKIFLEPGTKKVLYCLLFPNDGS